MTDRDRGATLVEYALGVALLCVALLGAINAFEDNTRDRYDDRSTQGTPAEEFGNLGPTGGGNSGGGDGGSTPSTSVASVVVQPLSVSATGSGNDWSITVTVSVTGDGQPLGGVTFTAPTWNPNNSGTSSCTTTSTGVCSYTQTMPRTGQSAVGSVSFTLGSPSYANPDGTTPTYSGPASSTVTCSAPATGNGTGSCS